MNRLQKRKLISSVRPQQGGQVMVEYALLIFFCFLAFWGAMAFFLDAAGDLYMNLVKVITLPFP